MMKNWAATAAESVSGFFLDSIGLADGWVAQIPSVGFRIVELYTDDAKVLECPAWNNTQHQIKKRYIYHPWNPQLHRRRAAGSTI